MKAIVLVMLAVQAAMFLIAVFTVALGSAPSRRRPVWSSVAVALVIVAATSYQIGASHSGQAGADVLQFAAPLLMGMGIMAALAGIRARRHAS